MKAVIRKLVVSVEETHREIGREVSPPTRKALAIAVITNPFAGRYVESLDEFGWGGDGWFGRNTYAGGADKLGHAWATMVLARATTGVLRAGGYTRVPAAIAGSALSWGLFLAVEVKDGFYYRFSPGDLAMNTAGAAFALLAITVPAVDRWLDFRVAYWPSEEYLGLWRGEYHGSKKGNSLNIAEDYSGETYLAALHLGGFDTLREWRYGGTWTRFVDLAVGFGTKGYKPDEPDGTCPPICYPETQHWYAGISVNAQGVFDWLFERRAPRLATVTHGLFEILNVPFGFVPLSEGSRMAPPRSDVPTE